MENRTRPYYLERAYRRAGIVADNWAPVAGFKANEAILHLVYQYYQSVYFENPEKLLWAGLARLTGGQVLFGMRNAVKIARDPCVLTQEIVAVAKDIFESLAWQHEWFLASPSALISACKQLDDHQINTHAYADCWSAIEDPRPDTYRLGNLMLLENEQRNTIQKHYENIRRDAYSNRYFRFTRLVMRNIHPHHRRFFFDFPLGDVTRIEDRWRWISHPKGMWPSWVALPQKERDRLVALSNEEVIAHRW